MPRLSLGWLKPPKVPADGVMSLADHLREFRYRVVVSALAIVLGMIAVAFFWQPLFNLLIEPLKIAQVTLKAQHPEMNIQAVLPNYITPFMLVLQLCMVGGLVLTSPIWLYQIWAYIVPALLAKEKKIAVSFIAVAVPLFLVGVVLAYIVIPQGIIFMLGFTPDNMAIANLLDVNNFLTLLLQLMVVFGIGFLVPVFIVALNMVGIISGRALKKARSGVIFGAFVFGAVATPGGDPFSMIALAVPMMVLFLIAERICLANDKRREKRLRAEGLWVEPITEDA